MLIHAWDAAPDGRMQLGMDGARLTVLQVNAKVKDDHDPVVDRECVIGRLAQRRHGLDVRAATPG